MKLTEGTALHLSTTADGIWLRRHTPRRARRRLADIVAEINSSNYRGANRASGNDAPVGKEL